jgi:hypothetical protein
MLPQQNVTTCIVCATDGITSYVVNGVTFPAGNCGNLRRTITAGQVLTATCGGTNFSSTCQANSVMTSPSPSIDGLKLAPNVANGNSPNHFVCTLVSGNGAAASGVCQDQTTCSNEANDINNVLGSGVARCDACNTSQGITTRALVHRRSLRQALGGQLVLTCPCAGQTGSALTGCCNNCFTVACQFAGPILTSCACDAVVVTCPGCGSGKESNKLLLLLLLLLLLIPCILCCCLLLCCLLRRRKRQQDTHFATFDPQAGAPVMAPPVVLPAATAMPMPTACMAPVVPTHGHIDMCAPCGPMPTCGSLPLM